MAANSCLLILILELVFSLTIVTSSAISKIIISRPIADKISNAVENLNFPKETKVAFLNQYINIGNYSKDFIELLNTYKTFKDLPISFNDVEIRILTSNTEDSFNVKTLAQLKYYRKGQEIQCAQYVTLHYKLYYDTKCNTKEIAEHVYNMIVMAYKGKFIVFDWLWKLHISLWSPTTNNAVQPLNMIADDLKKFRKPLADLMGMCVAYKYTTDIFKDLQGPNHTASRKIVDCHNLNKEKLIHYNYNKPVFPISGSHLFLKNLWSHEPVLIKPMPFVAIDWNVIKQAYDYDFKKVHDQFTFKQDWKKDPLRHIKFQQTFIDIFRVKLYCYIWVTLFINPGGYIISCTVKRLIANLLEFSYIEDKTLNQVLTFCDEPNQGQIEIVKNIIIGEVNTILTNLIGHTNKTELADIAEINKFARSDVGKAIETHLQELERWYKPKLEGLTLDVLSFFIDGSKNTHLSVFPGN